MARRTTVRFVGLLLTSSLLLGLLAYWRAACPSRADGPVPGLGNFPETVRLLPPVRDGRFRFAVLGDPEEGLDVFHRLMEKAHALGAAFVLITGDVADDATEAGFAAFLASYRSLGPKALPTFAAVGNHDIEHTGLFEKLLGPREHSFVHGDCLFIIGDNNAPGSRPGCAQFIRDEIDRYRGQVQHVFLVVHKPITDFEKQGHGVQRVREKSAYLYDILDAEIVDAVLAGHYHGYSREMYGETVLLVTGGAGGRLHSPAARYHMVMIDVGPEGIVDRVVGEDGDAGKSADGTR